jgi:hypothetical protein
MYIPINNPQGGGGIRGLPFTQNKDGETDKIVCNCLLLNQEYENCPQDNLQRIVSARNIGVAGRSIQDCARIPGAIHTAERIKHG